MVGGDVTLFDLFMRLRDRREEDDARRVFSRTALRNCPGSRTSQIVPKPCTTPR
jgi:hypothetical protein